MKYIYIIFAVIVSCMFMQGCEGDDFEEPVPEITIVKSQVSFDSNKGTGTIEFSSDYSVVVESNADWCKVKLKDKIVEIDVSENKDIIGRIAKITLATPNGYSTDVIVNQLGLVFDVDKDLLTINMVVPQEGKITVANSSEFTVEQVGDWFTYSIEDSEIFVNAEPVNTPRRGKLIIKSGNRVKEVKISQAYSYEEMLGAWSYEYLEVKSNTIKSGTVTFEVNEAGKSFLFKSQSLYSGYSLVLNYDMYTSFLSMDFHTVANTLGIIYMYLCPIDTEGNRYFTPGTPYIGSGKLENDKMKYVFGPSENTTGNIISVRYISFLGQNINESNIISPLVHEIKNLVLIKN